MTNIQGEMMLNLSFRVLAIIKIKFSYFTSVLIERIQGLPYGGTMKDSLYLFFLLLTTCATLNAAPADFFATQEIQSQAPGAFALQPESFEFIKKVDGATLSQRDQLVSEIQKNKELNKAIQDWATLTIDEQIPHLRKIFELEIQVLNVQAPELIIGSDEIPGRAAFFDFDVEKPGEGRVLLNPKVLSGMDKYASLALLIHETRHSAQFQMAFPKKTEKVKESVFAEGFYKAFEAQKKLPVRTFCDFLTLLNEHEAFQFGNYVVGKLTHWKVNLSGMGTLASQYDKHGHIKLSLVDLIEKEPKKVLENFNELEKDHCKELGYCEK